MPLTLLLPGALLPAELSGAPANELVAALAAPVLKRWLQRAALVEDRPVAGSTGDTSWIATHLFGLPPDATVPTAPYAWAELAGSAPRADTLWHADPVHVAVGRESLVVQSLGEAPPRVDEADALIAVANTCLAGSDAQLQRSGAHWFLQSATAWSLVTTPLQTALGGAFALPMQGEDARRWSRLHNAIQMSWHEHPVNERRDREGAPPINALWLHGGGRWAPLPGLPWSQVASDRPALRGAARAAGAEVIGIGAQAEGRSPRSGDAPVLIDLPTALPAAGAGDWSAWLAAMASVDRELERVAGQEPTGTVDLVLTARDRVRMWRVQPGDRLRFWRRHEAAVALSA